MHPLRALIPCLLAACSAASAQQYPFLSVPGSPKGVTNLFQDSTGRLWLGGAQLTCFDGSRFFNLRDYGFPPSQSYEITEDPAGAIWIAADTGLYRFSNGRVEEVAKGVVANVIAARTNIILAVIGPAGRGFPRQAALVRIEHTGNAWKAETVVDLNAPGPLTLDPKGILLYAMPGQGWAEIRFDDVVHWNSGQQLPITRHLIAHFAQNGPMKVMRDHQGCRWIGAVGEVAYSCDGTGQAAPYEGANTQGNMHEGPDGSMVVWGYSLLAVGRPGSFRVATLVNGLVGPEDVLIARDGTIWLGSGQGLFRFASPFRLEYWTTREGLLAPPWSVARDGDKIFAGLEGRIVTLSHDRLRWDPFVAPKTNGAVSALVKADDGTLFAGFQTGGASQYDMHGRELAGVPPGSNKNGMRLAKTAGGKVWLGGVTLAQLRRHGSVLTLDPHPLAASTSGNLLSLKYEEHTRKLWACYNGGLVLRDENGVWKEFTTRDGLLTNPCWSLAPLPNGDLWYAYYNLPALALIRPSRDGHLKIRQYGANDGIPDPQNDTLDADNRGWLWRGSNGVYVANAAEAEAGQWLLLDQSDGLPASGMNSGSVFTDTDGTLWWGADNDLVHFIPPADLVTPRFSPQVQISAFSWAGEPPRIAAAVGPLPHGTKLTAHIGSLQFDRRNGLRLRYRILPGQPAWRETKDLDLPIGSLSSGAHTLEVEGRVFTGPWSSPASRSFTILPPPFLAWPFLAAYFIAATALAAVGYLLYRRRQAESAELLPDLAPWRMGALLPEVHQLAGAILDSRFEVGGLLARGGFANVFSGHDRQQHQRCAVKIFRGEVKDKTWIQRSFEHEVAALQRVRHPHVVTIYAHGTVPSGAPYLVMEFVEGKNLREVLDRGPLPPRRVARLLRQLASALDAIHSQGICHRDVKPENIIIRNQGAPTEECVLIDFSIAIVKDANETLYGLSRAAGSFDYMAPEQAVGYAEPSSDIYSLAKLLIEMLTGRQLKELLPDAALDLPERVRDLVTRLGMPLSPQSIDMLSAALEFDPAKRPRVAGAFAAPLAADLESDVRAR